MSTLKRGPRRFVRILFLALFFGGACLAVPNVKDKERSTTLEQSTSSTRPQYATCAGMRITCDTCNAPVVECHDHHQSCMECHQVCKGCPQDCEVCTFECTLCHERHSSYDRVQLPSKVFAERNMPREKVSDSATSLDFTFKYYVPSEGNPERMEVKRTIVLSIEKNADGSMAVDQQGYLKLRVKNSDGRPVVMLPIAKTALKKEGPLTVADIRDYYQQSEGTRKAVSARFFALANDRSYLLNRVYGANSSEVVCPLFMGIINTRICGHSFSTLCLKTYVKQHLFDKSYEQQIDIRSTGIPCPLCRDLIRICGVCDQAILDKQEHFAYECGYQTGGCSEWWKPTVTQKHFVHKSCISSFAQKTVVKGSRLHGKSVLGLDTDDKLYFPCPCPHKGCHLGFERDYFLVPIGTVGLTHQDLVERRLGDPVRHRYAVKNNDELCAICKKTVPDASAISWTCSWNGYFPLHYCSRQHRCHKSCLQEYARHNARYRDGRIMFYCPGEHYSCNTPDRLFCKLPSTLNIGEIDKFCSCCGVVLSKECLEKECMVLAYDDGRTFHVHKNCIAANLTFIKYHPGSSISFMFKAGAKKNVPLEVQLTLSGFYSASDMLSPALLAQAIHDAEQRLATARRHYEEWSKANILYKAWTIYTPLTDGWTTSSYEAHVRALREIHSSFSAAKKEEVEQALNNLRHGRKVVQTASTTHQTRSNELLLRAHKDACDRCAQLIGEHGVNQVRSLDRRMLSLLMEALGNVQDGKVRHEKLGAFIQRLEEAEKRRTAIAQQSVSDEAPVTESLVKMLSKEQIAALLKACRERRQKQSA